MKKGNIIKLISTVLVAVMIAAAAITLAACPGTDPVKLTKYPITYTLNGGTNHADNPTEYLPTDMLVIKEATKEGSIFEGWTSEVNTQKQLTVTIPEGTMKDLTFVAHWLVIIKPTEGFSINYVLDGGTNHVDNPALYKIEELPLVIKEPTRTNHVFLGWTSAVSPTLDTDKVDKTVEIPAGYEGNLIFTAHWEYVEPAAIEMPVGYDVGKLKAPEFVKDAYAYDVKTNKTKKVKLEDYYGKKHILLSFWKESCSACRAEMESAFRKVYQQRSTEFVILAVHIEPETPMINYLKGHLNKGVEFNFPIIQDGSLNIFNLSVEGKGSYNQVTGLPANFMIDMWGYLYHSSSNAKTIPDFDLLTLDEAKLNVALDGVSARTNAALGL